MKISSRSIALDFGFDEVPSLAFFQRGVPTKCDVDLIDEGQVLKWILIEADVWVEPPVVEQLFLIESTRQEQEWPVEAAPTLVLFDSDEPHFYDGDLSDLEAVSQWVSKHTTTDNNDMEEASSDSELISEEYNS